MRWVGLLALGAIGLHELRYVLGPGAHAHETRAVHSYLPLAIALAALAFVVALIDFVSTLVAANSDRVRLEAAIPGLQILAGGDRRPGRDLRPPGVARGRALRRPLGGTARPVRTRRLVGRRLRASARRPDRLPGPGLRKGDRASRSQAPRNRG